MQFSPLFFWEIEWNVEGLFFIHKFQYVEITVFQWEMKNPVVKNSSVFLHDVWCVYCFNKHSDYEIVDMSSIITNQQNWHTYEPDSLPEVIVTSQSMIPNLVDCVVLLFYFCKDLILQMFKVLQEQDTLHLAVLVSCPLQIMTHSRIQIWLTYWFWTK